MSKIDRALRECGLLAVLFARHRISPWFDKDQRRFCSPNDNRGARSTRAVDGLDGDGRELHARVCCDFVGDHRRIEALDSGNILLSYHAVIVDSKQNKPAT